MIEKLTAIGFNVYESKAYKVLLSQGLLAASELSELAGIPQGRIYSVLKSLEQKGFCNVFSGPVKKFGAVNPKVAFQGLLQEKERALKEMEALSCELEEVFENREDDQAPLEFIQILTSKQSQVNKFDDLIQRSETTLYSFNKKPYATGFMRKMDEIINASAPLRKIIKKGVSVKAIFEAEDHHIQEFTRMVSYYQDIGEEIRICDKLPLKMLLSDNKNAMVSMKSLGVTKFKLTSMVVEHSDLTNALTELFEMYWEKGMTIEEYLSTTVNHDKE